MTIELYLAPAAGGKTEYAVAEARLAARNLDAVVRVCVPNPLQAAAWRRRLAQNGGALGVQVLTFNSLVRACLDATGTQATELAEPVKYRLLRAVIARQPLDYYAAIREKPGFVQVTGDLIALLKGELIFPERLVDALAALGAGPRLAELAAIYLAYQQALQRQGWADAAGRQWLAVEGLSAPAEPVELGWPLLIVDGFDDFTPAQLALLAQLGRHAGRLIVTLPTAELVDYGRFARTRREVETALRVAARPLPEAPPPSTELLRRLRRDLFVVEAARQEGPQTAVQLLEAPDRASEVRAALRWLKARIVLDGCATHEVALLARDIAPYRAHARQIAAEFGLPLTFAGGLPLLQSPVLAALLDLMRLHLPLPGQAGPALPRRLVVSAWRSPYFAWGSEEAAIKDGDADLLDALARQQRVIHGLSQWREAFAARAAVGTPPPGAVGDLELPPGPVAAGTQAVALRDKFDLFLDRTRPPTQAPLRDYVRWLEQLIGPDPQAGEVQRAAPGSLNVVAQARSEDTGGEDIAALHALKEILRGLVWAEQAVGEAAPMRYDAFYHELFGSLSAGQLELTWPQGRAPLLAASVAQARGLSFRAVAVLGLSEGAFPLAIAEDPFLRDADRAALRAEIGARLPASTHSEEREIFYEAISRPAQKLLLTRPVLADNGAAWVESPFWREVQRLLVVDPQRVAGDTAVPAAEAASMAEWWESAAAWPELPSLAGRDALQRGAAVWAARRTPGLSPWQGDLAQENGLLNAKYNPEHVWSASRLESYQSCGFAFFMGSLLGLAARPEPAEGVDAAQLGSIYHDIFEEVYNTLGGGEDLAADEPQVLAMVHSIAAPILDEAPRKQGFRATAWWSETRQEIVANVARSIVAMQDGAYSFYQAEAAFGFGDIPVLRLIDGQDELRLRGFIDRLDRDKHGRLRIIDYKLAGKARFTARAFAEGKKLQLPLYALAAREALGLGEIGDGFYWHYQASEPSRFTLAGAEQGVEGAINTAVAAAWTAVRAVRGGSFAPQVPEGGCPAYCPAAAFCAHYAPSGYG